MSQIPEALFYTKDHEWITFSEDGTALVGITDYAQESLGDITFVEFPGPSEFFSQTDAFGVIESVKAASDLFMPLDGDVIEINEDVEAEPELLNNDPYERVWLLKIRITNASQVDDLLRAEAYAELI